MSHRFFLTRLVPSFVLVCVFLPGTGRAQVCPGGGAGGAAGAEPTWNYPFLPPGGPYLTSHYPFAGWPGYRGATGNVIPGGLFHCRPPVPVYAPLPPTTGPDPLHAWNQRRAMWLGLGYVGWVGPYSAWPRPVPLSVGVYSPCDPRAYLKHERYPHWGPMVEPPPGPGPHPGCQSAGCMTLAVKVPQAAEVFVDGVRTAQTGTDRLFESPPLEPGKDFRYEVTARWVERGLTVERKKVVIGKPGEVLTVDLTGPEVVAAGVR